MANSSDSSDSKQQQERPIRKRKTKRSIQSLDASKGAIGKRRTSSRLNPSAATTASIQTSRSRHNSSASSAAVIQPFRHPLAASTPSEALIRSVRPVAMEKDNFFSRQVPYNTNDPKIIEGQERTLELLRANHLLNAYTFDVCIVNPDPVQRARIFDQIFYVQPPGGPSAASLATIHLDPPVIMAKKNIFSKQLPYNTDDKMVKAQQESTLELLRLNGALNQHTFDVCIANPDPVARAEIFNQIYGRGPQLRNLDDIDVSSLEDPPAPTIRDPRYYLTKPSTEMRAAEAAVLQYVELQFPVISFIISCGLCKFVQFWRNF